MLQEVSKNETSHVAALEICKTKIWITSCMRGIILQAYAGVQILLSPLAVD